MIDGSFGGHRRLRAAPASVKRGRAIAGPTCIMIGFPDPAMLCRLFASALLFAASLVAPTAFAADLPPDVLVKSRWMELTRADFDNALERVPEKLRFEFTTSPKRVQGVLNNLLVTKTLAAQARAHGTRPALTVPKGMGSDEERALAAAEIQRIEADASREFDAKKAAYEAKAREVYELDRAKYRAPEEVRLSDIAVEIKERGDAAALARAKEARQRVLAGEDFAKVAREYSDDETTRDKGGALPFVSRERLAKEYADGVFALTRVGEISEPIKAPSAYHVVRLEERRPARQLAFDEVRERIMQTLRQRYVADRRDLRIQEINTDASLVVNQPAIDALVTHVDPQLLEAPVPRKPRASAPK
jgi:peptidyl-prolyl cis-trans isomerase C